MHNKQNILNLADLIEATPYVKRHGQFDRVEGFNMGSLVHDCGTPSCIAGYAAQLAGDSLEYDRSRFGDGPRITDAASEWLGLEEDEAEDLFLLNESPCEIDQIKPQQAAIVLRNLVETGKVEWGIVGIDLYRDEDE